MGYFKNNVPVTPNTPGAVYRPIPLQQPQWQHRDTRPYNQLAVIAGVCILVFAPIAPVLGYLAINDIRRNGGRGKGLAVFSIVFGGFMAVGLVIGMILSVILPYT